MSTQAATPRFSERQAPVFNAIADDYDVMFTHSLIGRAQRSLVHEALRGHFRAGDHILDMNCGTGEDAIYLASQGMAVLACDISERMVDVAREKSQRHPYSAKIAFTVCANENLDALQIHASFDGAISNFGGLNCTADVGAVGRSLAKLVRPGGEVFLCLIGRTCAWEILWQSAHGNWGKALRRMKAGGAEARIGSSALRVYYPTVRDMRSAFAPALRLAGWRGIGVALPPSWMESTFQGRPKLVERLRKIDRWLGTVPLFRGAADHVLLRFVREVE